MKQTPKLPLVKPEGMQVRGAAFEVRKKGVARFDLTDPYHFALSLPWPGFLSLAFLCLMAINLVFAALYFIRPGCVANLSAGDFAGAFFFSLETLATVGYGEMAPATTYGHIIAAAEIIVGMAFVAIFTGLIFVRFARPRARILFAEQAVVTIHNGLPTLMVRVANGRLSMLSEARAKLGALFVETSKEGRTFRGIHDLALVRHELPVFPLTWTVMHVIDANSPLAGYSSASLIDRDVRLFISVHAFDEALGTNVRALGAYPASDIAFGKRYADAMDRDAQGRTIADLGRLSWLEDEHPDLVAMLPV